MSDTARTPLRQPLNRRRWATSMAIDTGLRQGAVDQRRPAAALFASISTTSLTSVRLAYTFPSPADTPYSGFPPSATFVMSVPLAGSMTVDECASPLKVNTRFEEGS